MANVKFGLGQVFQPTPAAAKNLFRVVLYTAAAIGIVTHVVTEIPAPIKNAINGYLVEVVALVHAFSKLFGVPVDEVKTETK